VVPPGGGKTLIGLEAARRLGRPTVVLCPNTAIQAQWMAQWQAAFGPDPVPATASRELPTPLTVLTYQALCMLGAAGDGEEAGGQLAPRTRLGGDGVLSLLHPNGRALIARLQAGGPWTLVLDECHHLLELWGRLLIGDYSQRCLLASEDPRDERALGAIRRALPAVGYRLTRAGVRAGESPVDRVLA